MVSPEVFAQYQSGPETGRRSADVVVVREGEVADVPGCLELVESVLGLDRDPWERSLTASVVDPRTEVTRDFWFPDLSFDGGEGVLARAALPLLGV
ncbi:MAG TPA: hypothetical protein VFX61_08470 [Micromonosporaceae bacterium]|nr:hypothetical protein [Micromonosporaceae bacterium]